MPEGRRMAAICRVGWELVFHFWGARRSRFEATSGDIPVQGSLLLVARTRWFHWLVLLCATTHFRIFSDASARHMGNSTEVAPLLSTREGRLPCSLPHWQEIALLLLIAWLYAAIL